LDYIDILQEILEYIDKNIREKLSVEILAERAGFSPYHFCRVFQWGVGFSIMEYVRKRRLAFAAADLGSGKLIIDIAFDYGYETHTGFTKAFRNYFGCTPEDYRKQSSNEIPKLPILSRTKLYVDGGIVMEPKIIKRPAVKIAGFLIKTKTENGENLIKIPEFWQECMDDGTLKKLHNEPFAKNHYEYGACFPENPENGEFEYIIGIEINEMMDVPKEYHVCSIPEATYAVFSSPPADDASFAASIQGTWKYIFSEWFPDSGYEFMENGVDFELYDERSKSETGKVMDVFVPVMKVSKKCE